MLLHAAACIMQEPMTCSKCRAEVGDVQPAALCGSCQLALCAPCCAAVIGRRNKLNAAKAQAEEGLGKPMRALGLCCEQGKALAGGAVDGETLADGATVKCSRCASVVADLAGYAVCGNCTTLTCGRCCSVVIERRNKLNAAKAQAEEGLGKPMRALGLCCDQGKALAGGAVDGEALAGGATVSCGTCRSVLADLTVYASCSTCNTLTCGACCSVAIERRTRLNAAMAKADAEVAAPMRKFGLCCNQGKQLTGSALDGAAGATLSCPRCTRPLGDLALFASCGGCGAVTCAVCAQAMVARATALAMAVSKGNHLRFQAWHMKPCPKCDAYSHSSGLYGAAVDGTPVPCAGCKAQMPDLTGYILCNTCKWTECPQCNVKSVARKNAMDAAAAKGKKKVHTYIHAHHHHARLGFIRLGCTISDRWCSCRIISHF